MKYITIKDNHKEPFTFSSPAFIGEPYTWEKVSDIVEVEDNDAAIMLHPSYMGSFIEVEKPVEEIQGFLCPHCDKIVKTAPGLKRHITKVHPNVG